MNAVDSMERHLYEMGAIYAIYAQRDREFEGIPDPELRDAVNRVFGRDAYGPSMRQVLCCALVVFSAMLGRYISTRSVAVAAASNKIESAQDIQTWFTGYGLDVDGTSITADKVKIPRKWDDSFAAFNGVVQQSGMDLTRYKGKTVEKWTALIPAASSGETSRYGVLLVVAQAQVGIAFLLQLGLGRGAAAP